MLLDDIANFRRRLCRAAGCRAELLTPAHARNFYRKYAGINAFSANNTVYSRHRWRRRKSRARSYISPEPLVFRRHGAMTRRVALNYAMLICLTPDHRLFTGKYATPLLATA